MSNLPPLRRAIFATLVDRLTETPARIQIVSGPRQVGKTTVVRQALDACELPSQYASADDPTLRDAAWLDEQWQEGRRLAGDHGGAVLAIDEEQKVDNWAEAVKRLWDEDRAAS